MRKIGFIGLIASAIVLFVLGGAPSPAGPPGGEETYRAKCAVCHGPDGAGQTARGKRLKLRDLRAPEVQKLTDQELFNIIAKGSGKDMPAYEKSLGAETVQQLVAYMRELAKKK